MKHYYYKFKFEGQDYYEDLTDVVSRYGEDVVKVLFDEKGIVEYSNELPTKEWLIEQRDNFKKSRDYLEKKVARYDEAILTLVANAV